MNKYNCLKNQVFSINSYSVVPYRSVDLAKIKDWRNEQIDVLRQKKKLTDQDQLNYYHEFIEPSFHENNPRIILFSFLLDNNLIGYGGLTNCSWEDKRSELSFLLSTERAVVDELYEKDFSVFINLMKKINFMDLEFNRLFTETYDIRPHHISILEKNGFVIEGRMREHIIIKGQHVDSLIHGCLRSSYSHEG